MSIEPKDPQPDKSPNQIGLGLAMGAGVGTLFGILFENLAIGITFGAALVWFLAPRSHKRTKRVESRQVPPSDPNR